MRNIYEILREKELQIKTLEKEIEALRVVARILSEEEDQAARNSGPKLSGEPTWKPATGTTETRPYTTTPTAETEIKTQGYSATSQNATESAKVSRPWP